MESRQPPQVAERVQRHARVTVTTSVIIALLAAGIFTAIVLGPRLLELFPSPGDTGEAAVTLRAPLHQSGDSTIIVESGQSVDGLSNFGPELPAPWALLVAAFACLFLATFFFSTHTRRSHKGKLLRHQVVSLAWLAGLILVTQVVLLFTAIPLVATPLVMIALLTAIRVDLAAGFAIGALASVIAAWLVPFDVVSLLVLFVQATAGPMLLAGAKSRTNKALLIVGLVSGILASATYAGLVYMDGRGVDLSNIADPTYSAFFAGIGGGIGAALLDSWFQISMGQITKSKLVVLGDLSNPLLQQIATNAPGTWQHSLAMANMAEICANDIGADGRLVRVGAYYHDLGKSFEPKYFVENLQSDETSPHKSMTPEASCAAIHAHVTSGIEAARDAGLPEPIIDFMHMHHGNGLLEFFWHKCQEDGNPNERTEDDFRYPGVPPQSKETAILAIVDAVEAASRTLQSPDERAIKTLVQRIVYGKLDLGQLDESGLTMSDLRQISKSLCSIIKHAHHGRIRYPWQDKEDEEAAGKAKAAGTSQQDQRTTATETPNVALAQTQAMRSPLDSLDQPLPKGKPASEPARWGAAIKNALVEPGENGESSAPIDSVATDDTQEVKASKQAGDGQRDKNADSKSDVDDGPQAVVDEPAADKATVHSASDG